MRNKRGTKNALLGQHSGVVMPHSCCWHSIKVLVLIPATSLLIQFPTIIPVKAQEDGLVLGLLLSAWESWVEFQTPGFHLVQLQPL